jgi:hypothetical protein
MQWAVTVTDSNGHDWLFIVAARGEGEALRKGRDFFKRGAPAGVHAVKAVAQLETRR